MYVECRILHNIHILEVAVQLVLSLATKDFSKDLRETLELMRIIGETELAGQLIAFDLVVHGDQSCLATIE